MNRNIFEKQFSLYCYLDNIGKQSINSPSNSDKWLCNELYFPQNLS